MNKAYLEKHAENSSLGLVKMVLDRDQSDNQIINCLKSASQSNQEPSIKDLLGASESRGYTPLHLAIKYGRVTLAKKLIEAIQQLQDSEKAELFKKQTHDKGYTPLHLAIKKPIFSNIIQSLIEACPTESVLSQQTKYNNTPLHLALKSQSSREIVLELIKKCESNLSKKNNGGYHPLHLAIKRYRGLGSDNRYHVIDSLIQATPIESLSDATISGENTPLHLLITHLVATPSGQEAVLSKLLAKLKGANKLTCIAAPNKAGFSPLHLAVDQYRMDDVVALIGYMNEGQMQKSIHLKGETALGLAIAKSNGREDNVSQKIAKMLIGQLSGEFLIKKDGQGNTPLHLAALYKNQTIFNLVWQKVKNAQNILEKDSQNRSMFASAYVSKYGLYNFFTKYIYTSSEEEEKERMFQYVLGITHEKLNSDIKGKIKAEIDAYVPPTKKEHDLNKRLKDMVDNTQSA